jgi:hypothetical protein
MEKLSSAILAEHKSPMEPEEQFGWTQGIQVALISILIWLLVVRLIVFLESHKQPNYPPDPTETYQQLGGGAS